MDSTSTGRKNRGVLQFPILFLLGYSLAGCELSGSVPLKSVVLTPEPTTVVPTPKPVVTAPKPFTPTPKPAAPVGVQSPPAQTIRTIIYFQHPTTDSSQLSGAIAEACRCQPVFFRQYRDNALIYIIGLPQDISFAVFENTLLQKTSRLGIKSIEQDSLEHFQIH